MFGNTTGWLISAVISLVAAIFGWKVIGAYGPTPPTGWVSASVHPLGLADLAKAVLPPRLDVKDDAGDYYRDAIADYKAHRTSYEGLLTAKDFDPAETAQIKGLDAIVKAADCQSSLFYSRSPKDMKEVINFKSNVDDLDNLSAIGKSLGNAIALAKYEREYGEATKYANGLLAMGYNLYQERLAYVELSTGESMMGVAAASLKSIYEAEKAPRWQARAEAMRQFDDARKAEFSEKIEPVWKVIGGQDSATIGQYAGDMFQLAADPKADKLWRIEAMKKVGRLQFNAENKADQLKVPRFLDQVGADIKEDPAVKVAATAARNMTEGDNQSLR